jgi:8-oxo-dGTP pyrophosphatase MutT (NUDIX family)
MTETQAPIRDGQVLLAEKQKKIGASKLNGIGGKMEPGDRTYEQTMIREAREEAVITPKVYQKMGEVLFHNPSDNPNMRVHMFVTTDWEGEPTSTEELKNFTWFDTPLSEEFMKTRLMAGDRKFINQILSGIPMTGVLVFNEDWTVNEKLTDIHEKPEGF